MPTDLPAGTVTFLFTDVEGSTRLLHSLGPEAYAEALAEHRLLIREACAREGGVEVDTQGDAFFFAVPTAPGALAAAAALTEALSSTPIRVRCGLHTGTPLLAEEGYVGHDVHRAARIAAAGHGGQVLVSASTASLLDDRSLRDLGEHRFKDLGAPERVYQLGAGDFPPLKSLHRTNLPVPATAFLGREHELGEIVSLLAAESTRLLTLSGPGGTGKTRLALQAAAEASDHFPDGVYWVALAPLRDPTLVLASIAQALSVREQPGLSAADAIASFLEAKRVLVLADNCEHLLPAASELASLLARTSGLTLLATSRETLRLQAEVEYAVPTLASEEAVGLFCERGQIAPSDTVRELCVRLDNLPLALELAAARLKLLSPEQLLERLSGRLDLLKGGRDADPRQQTLRATIEWSYDLLSPVEQELFARLSVFQGGCALEAAEQVCDADLETLESLLDKSLLRRRDTDLGPRFWMLETIREFAAERLVEAGEGEWLGERHAAFFLALAEELEPPLMGGGEAAISQLSPEIDNLRAAIDFYAEFDGALSELRLVGALFRFWETAGLIREGRARAERALARSPRAEPDLRARVLYAASLCAYHEGDLEACVRFDGERLAIARAANDFAAIAVVLSDLGLNARELKQFDNAAELFEESRRLAAEAGADETLWAVTGNLAALALERGDHRRAIELLDPQLTVARDRDAMFAVAMLGHPRGWAALRDGDVERAAAHFTEALQASIRVAGPVYSSRGLVGLAAVSSAVGRAARAARLLGAASAAQGEGGFRGDMFEIQVAEDVERADRETLGDETWQGEFAAGASMSLDDAIDYALREIDGA